jgi:hypothetical protein
MGPAASPMSEMVPNTPIAAPRPRVEAISALAHRAIAAMPRPRSGATARTPRGFRSERSSEAQLFRTIAIGVAEPDNLGVDRQEAESAVAKVHNGFDAGGDEDRGRRDEPREVLANSPPPAANVVACCSER